MKNLYFFPFLIALSIFSCSDEVGDISGKWEYYAYYCDRASDFDVWGFEVFNDTMSIYDYNYVILKYTFAIDKDSIVLTGESDTLKLSILRMGDTLLIDSTFYVRNDSMKTGKVISLAEVEGETIFTRSLGGYSVWSIGIYHQPLFDESIDESRVYNLRFGDKVSSIEDLPLFLQRNHRSYPAYINIYPDKNVNLKHYLEILMTIKYSGYFKVNVITNKPGLEILEGFRETKTFWKDELIHFEELRSQNGMPLPPPPLPPTRSELFTIKQFIKEIEPLSIIHLDKSGYYFINQSLKSFPDEVMLDDSGHYLFVCDEAMSMKTYGQFRVDLQRYLQSRKETHALNLFFKPFNELTIDQKQEVSRNIPKVFFVGKSFYEEYAD